MFNKVKDEIYLPECFRTAQITMIHKKKCKLDLNNWREIFVTSVLRTILMKILHERIYHQVESSMTDSQIGSLKNKSVRNHLFVVNSVISDVLSSAKKPPIDLNVMDYKQMFDAEDLKINLNALYEAGIQDDILALIHKANKDNVISVKTPNGTTRTETIHNKIMQGDVLGPLLSSNMVDKNIGEVAIRKGICYMYKDKVPIPPLAMVNDTLGISVCGVETTAMSSFLKTRTNIMNLQFGCDKCEKIHVGKKQYTDICPTLTIDSWEEKLVEGSDGNKYIEDTFSGKKIMKEVEEKKYLGDIISKNGNNKSNIKDRTNRAMGTVNKIIETISERPYGKHLFKALKLMREAMVVSGLLTNSETWINITLKDLEDLEKPDIILQRKILSSSGNPSKCFMQLELGLIPLKFIMM